MNNIKVKDYRLKFKDNGCGGQRRAANGFAGRMASGIARCLLVAAMLVAGTNSVWAQSETVTVGTGTSGTYYAPVCNYYTYGRSASIYTASEIGQAGCITQIEWYCNSNNQSVTCSEFKIYLTTTSNETFGNSNSFPTSATNVYSRTTSMTVGGATGWKSFTLDEPFFYNGTDNLIIIVTAKTSRYNTSLTWRYSTKSNSTVYYGNDNTSSYGDFGTNSITGRIDNRPNIRLTFKKFYFSATATANAGGSASVSPTTTNVIGTTSCESATTTATFTATPNTGYRFKGWSTTSDGTPISTANPYVATITSTSTNSGSPTNTRLYAQFEEIPEVTAIAADVEDVSVCEGGTATFSYTLTPADAYDNVTATSGNTGVATVSKDGHSITVTGVTAGSATITLSAAKLGGGAPVTTTVDVTVTARCTAPTIGAYDNATGKVTITPAASTTVYYTTNGNDPTDGSTEYTEPIDVTAPVTIKAVAYRDGYCPSTVASRTIEQVARTEIEITTTAINFTSATAGVTFYYTTDGNTPTTSSSSGSSIAVSGITDGATIKVIATKNGMLNSAVASKVYHPASGTTADGKVILNDLEDHSWSYYSDDTQPIHRLSPADVKITYNGYGNNTKTTTHTSSTPSSSDFNGKVDAADVAVSATESANTFIYYKTLENANENGSGNYPYTMIPNPFQKRPTGTDNGNVSMTPSTRVVYISTSRTSSGWGYGAGTLTVTYYDANNNQRTSTLSIGQNSQPALQITVKAGTTISFSLSRTSNNNSVSYSAKYDGSSGTEFSSKTANNSTTQTDSKTIASNSAVSVNCGIYRGFYGWRIKSLSGGLTITGKSVGDIVYAEDEIEFVTSNATGNEIVFEALWAQAYVTTGTTDLSYTAPSYERNFHVVTSSTSASSYQKSYPLTVTAYYPNGSSAGGSVSGGFTAAADTKFENIEITGAGSSIWTANCNDLIIGRGVTGTVYYLTGMRGAVSSNTNFRLRVESGTFNFISFADGSLGTPGNASTTWSGTNNLITSVLGCDYDRALGSSGNNNLDVTGSICMGAAATFSNQDVTKKTLDVTIKSGKFLTSLNGNMGDGDAEKSLYMAVANVSNSKVGERCLTIEGGVLANIAGGIDAGNQSANSGVRSFTMRMKGGTVNGAIYGGAAVSPASGDRYMVITGGEVKGWIGAGCNGVLGTGSTTGGQTHGVSYLYIGGNTKTGGSASINGSDGGTVFGAGKGSGGSDASEAESGQMSYGTNLVIADNADILNNAYGGGNYGYSLINTNVYIYGGTVHGSVFGGSNENKGVTINITMKDGLVEGGIYGGSNTTGTISGNVTMNINGGQVGTTSQSANIHGGGYGQSTVVSGNVEVNLGTCGAPSGVTVYGDVYGGSALGTVNASSSNTTTVNLYKGTIYGGLYGGALGDLASLGTGHSNVDARVKGAVAVNVFGGSVLCSTSDPNGEAGTGSVFGCNNVNGRPESTVNVNIYNTDQPESGYALHAVYGGGNKAAYNGTPVVTIHGCNNKIEYVYGGGNATNVNGTDVTIWGGTIGNAFGGGNGFSETKNHTNSSAPHYNPGANITTSGTHLTIHGGSIGAAFGGSNQFGTIDGGITVDVSLERESDDGRPACVDPYTQCTLDMDVIELYGGGNEAPIQTSGGSWITPVVNLDCSAKLGMLFGGAKAADYTGNINLVVNGGTFGKVFGGNNKGGTITGNVTVTFNGGSAGEVYGGCNESGTITGTIQVNIDSTNSTCDPRFYVGDVYGGGNMAPYSHASGNYPEVNIINGTIRNSVYGGGYGTDAVVTGSPKVTIGVSDANKKALVLGNVFGGGNAAGISGNTNVNVLYNSVVKKSVFGGGNAAPVSNNTEVILSHRARVHGNIYGGGNQGEIGGDTKVIVNSL